jgi:hypothetical protein
VRSVVGLLVLSCSTLAHADDPRDVFGLGKKPKQQQEPLDCSDGTEFGCVGPSDPLDENASLYSLTSWLSAEYLMSLPTASATQADVAHFALGAGQDAAGPTFRGANGLENRWLVEGAPADNVRTGVADTRIPLTFLEGIWVTAGGFTARDLSSTGGVIDAKLKRGTKEHEVDSHVWVGWTAKARQRATVANSYTIRRGELDAGPDASVALAATGPLEQWSEWLGGTAWYALGVGADVSSTKFTWRSATLADANNDGLEDGFPGIVVTVPVDEYSRTPITWNVPFMLRGGLDRGVHSIDLNLVGSVGTDARFLFNSTLPAAGVDGRTLVGDAIATWRGKWTNTRARAQLAWHRSMRHESARDDAAADIPQVLNAYVPTGLVEDAALSAACDDMSPTDPFPMIVNCPVPSGWFTTGGAGPLTDTTGDRPSITADIAHRIGNNIVRAGATGEDTRLVQETQFTGGMQIRSLFPGHMSQRQFADPNATCPSDPALPCPTVDSSVLRYRTRYTAAYLEDTWHATDRVAVDGGLRWELMWVGPVLHFSDELSPRLGASWDPLGQGRSRVWASMGRSYAYLPAGLGSTIMRRDKTVDRVLSPFGEGRSVDLGAPIAVAPDVEPISQDELKTGARIALARAVQVTAWLQGTWLRRGLETTLAGFDNPGRDGSTPAIRETTIFATEIATAPTAQLVLRVGYMYGRSLGSWTGAFNPREGAVLYAGSDFDTPAVNLVGPLPNDLGHRTYIEAERTGHVGSVKLGVAARLTTASGRPRSVLADSDEGIIYLIPRGTAGRGPMLTQANIRIGALWRGVDITLDLFNVFNRREAVATDEFYARGSIRPVDGGTLSDLVFLKNDDGSAAQRRPSYATGSVFQSPFSAVLGVSHTF